MNIPWVNIGVYYSLLELIAPGAFRVISQDGVVKCAVSYFNVQNNKPMYVSCSIQLINIPCNTIVYPKCTNFIVFMQNYHVLDINITALISIDVYNV